MANYYNYYDLDKIKEIPIQDILQDMYGIESKKKGLNRAFCDIRGEKTPSCCLYLDTNTYCDFGDSNRGGNVINLVQQLSNVGFNEAVKTLSDRYGIVPERMEKSTFPTAYEFKKIGIAFEKATMNFDFDFDKYGDKKTIEFAKKYADMNMKELAEKEPTKYHNSLKQRAVPYIKSVRENYYSRLHSTYKLWSELGGSLDDMDYKQFADDCKELKNMENILTRAITDSRLLQYKPMEYDAKSDLNKILNGTIQFETGNTPYIELKTESKKANRKLSYKKVRYNDFISHNMNFDFDYAAFVNAYQDEVNIITFSDNEKKLETALTYQKELETAQVAEKQIDNTVKQSLPIQEKKFNTVVVNMFAGPGAGKTTCAWEVASALKKKGIVTEYVSEVAKEYVWDNQLDKLDGSLEKQRELLEEQDKRVQRLMGKVEVIVTDSPILLNLMYLKEPNEAYNGEVVSRFKKQNNFNVFVDRGKNFEKEGRIHDYADSVRIDSNIENLLNDNQLYFKKYSYPQIKRCIENIDYTVKKANGRPVRTATKTAQPNFIKQYCNQVYQNEKLVREIEVMR